MSKTAQRHWTKLNKNKTKRQKCRQSVVTGREQLHCAVQSEGLLSVTTTGHSSLRRSAIFHCCISHHSTHVAELSAQCFCLKPFLYFTFD